MSRWTSALRKRAEQLRFYAKFYNPTDFIFWPLWAHSRLLIRGLRKSQPIPIESYSPAHIINLESRPDRRASISTALKDAGITDFSFFVAKHNSNGHLGCAESHIELLKHQKNTDLSHFFVLEDDFEPVEPLSVLQGFLSEFLNDSRLDVLCLSHHTSTPTTRISGRLRLTSGSQTTTGYVVKRNALSSLIQNFEQARAMLELGRSPKKFAIDQYWKRLQRRRLLFCIPSHPLARPSGSWSSIENS